MDRTRTEKKFLISDWTTKILKISDQIGPIGSWIPGLNQSRYFNRSSTVFFDWLFLKSIDQGFTNKMVSNDGTAISNKQIGGLINGSIRCCSPWCTSFSCSDNLFATKIFALKISKNYQLATWTGTKLVPLQVFIDMLTLRLTESSETSRLWAFENKWSKIKSQIQYHEVCVILSHDSWRMLLLELTSTCTTRKLHEHSWIILSTSTMVGFITKLERVFRHDSSDNLNHGTISKAFGFVSFIASKEVKNSSQNANVFWKTFHSESVEQIT